MRIRALTALACLLLASWKASAVNVGGPIVSDTTWTLANSPYIVTSSIIIGGNATLTIQPGVTVKVNAGLGITVGSQAFGAGALKAIGTASQRITFTSNPPAGQPAQPGQWKDIQFTDRTVDAAFDAGDNYVSGSILQHCVVEYAGGGASGNGAVTITQASPFLTYCEVRFTSRSGIYASNTNPTPTLRISNSNLHSNVATIGGGAQFLVHNLAFVSNTVSNNSASSDGGGIHLIPSSFDVVIAENVIYNNAAASNGGGISSRFSGGTTLVRFENNSVVANRSLAGGGIHVRHDPPLGSTNGQYIFSNNIISSNLAVGQGGSPGIGGGICILNIPTGFPVSSHLAASFTSNRILGNRAQSGPSGIASNGGGVYVSGSWFANSTINLTGNQNTGDYNTLGGNHADRGEAIFLGLQFNKGGNNDIQAVHVCWGGQDPNPVVSPNLIYDYFDDPTLAFVVYPPHVEGPNCAAVLGCAAGLIPDCNGNCAPASWVGDGLCDSGIYRFNGVPIFFNCPQFGNDAGDCNAPLPPLLYPPNNAQPVPQPPVIPLPPPTVQQTKLLFVTHGARTTTSTFNAEWKPLEEELQSMLGQSWKVIVRPWAPTTLPWSILGGYPPSTALNEAYREANQFAGSQDWTKYQYVHLVAHSAGSMLISRLAERIQEVPGGPVVHCTFLDAFPVGWFKDPILGLPIKPYATYFGEDADWADQYFSRENVGTTCNIFEYPPLTSFVLPNVFNVDVTLADPDYDPVCLSRHKWPVCFWRKSALGGADAACPAPSGAFEPYGFGLGFARAGNVSVANWLSGVTAAYPAGCKTMLPVIQSPPSPPECPTLRAELQYQVRSDPPVTLAPGNTGTSGGASVTINPNGFAANTQAGPAWINIQLNTTQPINAITFNLAFANAIPAQGVLSVHFNGQQASTHDERFTPGLVGPVTVMLDADTVPGTHTVSFRLDGYGGGSSSVVVDSIATGFGRFVPPCPADFNDDGTVSTPDLTFFLGRFGQPATPGSLAERADFNGDGTVNTPDLTFFLGRFGQPCP